MAIRIENRLTFIHIGKCGGYPFGQLRVLNAR